MIFCAFALNNLTGNAVWRVVISILISLQQCKTVYHLLRQSVVLRRLRDYGKMAAQMDILVKVHLGPFSH
jgi:hypothetical protein